MFRKLLRDIFDTPSPTRVGFVTEPTALVASPDRRALRRVALDAWSELAARHGAAAMSASLVGAEDDKHGHAVVLVAGVDELIVVELPSRKDRAAFIAGFIDHEHAASRALTRFDAVAIRINPPPPPPPPGYPPPELLARLEAGLRVLRLPVLVASVEMHVGLDAAGRDR